MSDKLKVLEQLERLEQLEARRDALHGPGPEWHKPIEQRAEFKQIALELLLLAREVKLPNNPVQQTKE